jgi:hypothetical protein
MIVASAEPLQDILGISARFSTMLRIADDIV